MGESQRVCVGVISGVHGVRGLIKVKPFTHRPEDIVAYGALTDVHGRRTFRITLKGLHKGQWLAEMEGVADRNAAEALKGTELFVDRATLPPPDDEDEFYHADLIGLTVEDRDGAQFGTVRSVHDFGAGDVVEIIRVENRGTVMIPFTREAVPEVDIKAGRIVVVPPPGLVEPGNSPDREPEGDETGADNDHR